MTSPYLSRFANPLSDDPSLARPMREVGVVVGRGVVVVFWTVTDSLVDTLEPSANTALAARVCAPFASVAVSRVPPLYVYGDVVALYCAPPSTVRLTTVGVPFATVAWNETLPLTVDPADGAVIETVGEGAAGGGGGGGGGGADGNGATGPTPFEVAVVEPFLPEA
jgi:hypothetical protein